MTAKQPFFVTGLPRSRTAWMANWLTTDTAICYHDEVFALAKLHLNRVTGFSGPELATQYQEISNSFPLAPWLVILRNSDEAFEAFMRVADLNRGRSMVFWKDRCDLLSKLCAKPNVLTVKVEDLDSESTAREVWQHLTGAPFDLDRWLLLWKLNVQQDMKKAPHLWLS